VGVYQKGFERNKEKGRAGKGEGRGQLIAGIRDSRFGGHGRYSP
jgi:hypothetical protein